MAPSPSLPPASSSSSSPGRRSARATQAAPQRRAPPARSVPRRSKSPSSTRARAKSVDTIVGTRVTSSGTSGGAGADRRAASPRLKFRRAATSIIAMNRLARSLRAIPGRLRKSSEKGWNDAKVATARRAGITLRQAGLLLASVLFALLAAATFVLGPHFILASFSLVKLDQPVCDGTLYIFQCQCVPGQESDQATWSNLFRKGHCSPCDLNEFKMEKGNWGCSRCPAHTTSPKGGTECSKCPKGTARRLYYGKKCMPCPANTFVDHGIPSGCADCAAHWTSEKGSLACSKCPKGTVRPSQSLKKYCQKCPVNTFVNHESYTGCEACAAHEVSDEGALECSACSRGKVRPSHSSKKGCQKCPANTKVDHDTYDGCRNCKAHTFSAKGATECKECAEGTVRPSRRSKGECKPCPRNTYRSKRGRTGCHECPVLEFSGEGAEICECRRGAWRPGSAASRRKTPCAECPQGTFKNVSGDAPCTTVRRGFVESPGHDREVPGTSWKDAEVWSPATPLRRIGLGIVEQALAYTGLHAYAVASKISAKLREVLQFFYSSLFGGEAGFQHEYYKSGGDSNTRGWESAEGGAREKKKLCPFSDADAVWGALRRGKLYANFQSAKRDCRQMKRAMRKIVLDYHPDKFTNRYPGCDPNLSQTAFIKFREEFESAQRRC